MFIVSDSEEVELSGEEEGYSSPKHSSPAGVTAYHTPLVPTTGLVFWGSNEVSEMSPKRKAFTCVKKRPPIFQSVNGHSKLGK